jgi:hypothetical protein
MKSFTRREVLSSVGLAAGAGLLACRAAELRAGEDVGSDASKGSTLVPLDAAVVADKAYRIYPEGACMYATFASIVSSLGELVGEPYRSFPLEMMRYGEGGVSGWGSLCGALNGAAAVIGFVFPGKDGSRRAELVAELFSWYEQSQLPKFRPTQTAVSSEIPSSIAKSVANSVLCHVSVSRWCKVSRCDAFSPEKRERCRRLTADVVLKTVELLNRSQEPSSRFAGLSAETNSCVTCHGKSDRSDVMVKMRCDTCHTRLGKCPEAKESKP